MCADADYGKIVIVGEEAHGVDLHLAVLTA